MESQIMTSKLDLSVVIPVYNSSKIFPELYSRLISVISNLNISFEIITVIDGNNDGSLDVIESYALRDARLKVICFSRSFGQQMALTAGMQHASGEIISIIDDDLEDPPEVIPQLLSKLHEGFDVVYGIRSGRKVSPFKKILFHLFYRVLNFLSTTTFPNDVGDFCVLRKKVVLALISSPERNKYIRGLRSWVGFKQTGIKYVREERYTGKSGFNLLGYFKFASDAICSFSYKPLTYVSIAGFCMAIITFFLGCWVIVSKLMGFSPNIPGFAFTSISVLFIGSIQLISIGVLGQYVSRIYDEVKQRPPFIIDHTFGFANSGLEVNIVDNCLKSQCFPEG